MRWGVTYSALLVNGVFTMEVFLLTKNLLTLALALPIHGICALLCARDARFFDLALLWGRTRIPALLANADFWRSSSYSPLAARPAGRSRAAPDLDRASQCCAGSSALMGARARIGRPTGILHRRADPVRRTRRARGREHRLRGLRAGVSPSRCELRVCGR